VFHLYFLKDGSYQWIGSRESEQDCNELAASYNENYFRIEYNYGWGSMVVFDNTVQPQAEGEE
jgi:hypothetical protein